MKRLLVAAGMILLLAGCASEKEVTPVSELPADHKVELQAPDDDSAWISTATVAIT
ncbi:lipoprotein [Bacillus cereus]|uniref:lipoprotein n=1 Tax=Bacillus cereus TaxID=1396 RepID=UPI00164335DC|nr:lipoprotein [Bacillus cereus]